MSTLYNIYEILFLVTRILQLYIWVHSFNIIEFDNK